MTFLSIILAIFSSYMLWSLIEYIVHRWPMHELWFAKTFHFMDVFESHVILHHNRFYKKSFERSEDRAAKYVSMDLSACVNVLGTFFIWMPMWFIWPTFVFPFLFWGVIQAVVWSAIHREMHEPSGAWYSKNFLYRFLRNNHELHHKYPNYNFCAALPGMDWIFGTYRNK